MQKFIKPEAGKGDSEGGSHVRPVGGEFKSPQNLQKVFGESF